MLLDVETPISRRIPLATGLSYHVLEWGRQEPALEHTVVLLHGFLDLAWTWVPTVEAGLAGRFHLLAPDLRGHGDSDRIGAGGYYHFVDYLADLDDLVRQLGRRRLSLVGHSMGGTVASYYAGTYPDRVHRLALLEGTGPPESGAAGPARTASWLEAWRRLREKAPRAYPSLEEAAARLRAHDRLLGADRALELARHGTVRRADGQLEFKHDPLHVTPGPNPFSAEVALRYFGQVTCPTLLVEGSASVFRHAPAEAARRAGAFRHARKAVVQDAGHMMQRHQPAALAALLLDFLS